MPSNSIAKASLELTTDSGGLNKGLSDSESKLKAWGNKQQSQQEKAGKDSGEKAGKASQKGVEEAGAKAKPPTWLGRITQGATLIAGTVTVVAGAVAALTTVFSSLSDGIAKTVKQARELGVGVEGFSALAHAGKVAGVGVEDITGAVTALETALQGTESDRYFQALGLDVDALRKLPVDEATSQIADGLKGIADPAERARLALAIFGDKAVQLKPLLDKGGEGIRALTDEARKSGVAIGDEAAAKVLKAREALARMGTTLEGLTNTVVIAAAPWIDWGVEVTGTLTGKVWSALTAFGQGVNDYLLAPVLRVAAPVTDVLWNLETEYLKFSLSVGQFFLDVGKGAVDWASSMADEVAPTITSALETIQPYTDALAEYFWSAYDAVSEALASMADAITDGLAMALEALGIDSKAAFQSVADGITWLQEKFKQLWDYVAKFWDYITRRTAGGDALRSAADAIATGGMAATGETAGEAIGKGIQKGIDKGTTDPLNNVKAKVLQGVTALEKELQKSIDTVGLTGSEAKIKDLEKQGADPKQLEALKALAEEARILESAFSVVERFSPDEVFRQQIEGLEKLRDAGKITEEQFSKGVGKASQNFISASGSGPLKSVGGAVENSSAAVSAVIKASLQDRVANDPAAELRRAQAEQKEIQKKQVTVSEAILAEIKRGNDEQADVEEI